MVKFKIHIYLINKNLASTIGRYHIFANEKLRLKKADY
jgi:hypothetical protein